MERMRATERRRGGIAALLLAAAAMAALVPSGTGAPVVLAGLSISLLLAALVLAVTSRDADGG
jgi:hypothetical protein